MSGSRWLLIAVGSSLALLMQGSQSGQDATPLSMGNAVERQIAGTDQQNYRISLQAGESATIAIDQLGIDVVARVVDQTGKPEAEFNGAIGDGGQERVLVVADQARDYLLSIQPSYTRDPVASYRAQVVEIHAATEDERFLYEAHRLSAEEAELEKSGKYEEAIQREHAAVTAAEKIGGSSAYLGYLLGRLGNVLRVKGETAQAKEAFRRAIVTNQQMLGDNDPQTIFSIGGLGVVYMVEGDYAKAEPLLQQQVEVTSRTLGVEHPRLVSYLISLSTLYWRRQDMERALTELQRALAIAEKRLDRDDFGLMAATNNLGNVYLDMNNYAAAKPLLERALSMIEKKYGNDNYRVAVPLQDLGSIARHDKNYSQALAMYSRAYEVDEKALGKQHPTTVSFLVSMANVYTSEGEYGKAIELDQQALAELEPTVGRYHKVTLLALTNLARVYAAQGDLPNAIEYQKRCNEVVEKDLVLNVAIGSEREKLEYLSSISEVTDRTISLQIQQAPHDTATCELAALVLLQRHGRALDILSGSHAALRQRLDTQDGALLDELDQTNAKLARLALSGPGKIPVVDRQRQLHDLEQRTETLESEISGRSSEFQAQSESITLSAVRATIPEDAVLIEFATYRPFDPKRENPEEGYGEPRYVAYAIHREGKVQWRDLGNAKAIDSEAAALRDALRDPKRDDVEPLARRLDVRVMQPLRGTLGVAKHLLLAPEGVLNLVPFEALMDEHNRFLVERYAISYLSSGRDLLRMQVARNSKSGPLLLANPFFGDASGEPKLLAQATSRRSITTATNLSEVYFAPLSGTAIEARSIQSLFPDAQVLLGRQATVAALKQAHAPSILHIATHGFFLETEPKKHASQLENPLLRSGLAFADSNLIHNGVRDGILTALEASGMDLWGTKLVTLSACDSGVGDVRNGEGVYGLRRAFILAGAESLVMSLWPVSDYATRKLMTSYYTGLRQGLGRGAALRQAQLAILRRPGQRHPFYWASFIQAGNWTNLNGK